MPRPRKQPPPPANSLVASAAQITSARKRGVPRSQGTTAWQGEVWDMLDQVGELEFYRLWITNIMSRVTLYVTQEQPDGSKQRIETGLAADALAALFGGEQGQSQMLGAMAGHLSLIGETWLVGLLDPPEDVNGPDMWRVLSNDEVKREAGRYIIDTGDGEPETYADGSQDGVDPQVYVTRIWRPHPRKSVEAHSSIRPALPILRELLGLTQRVAADIDSRLAGAGMLVVPSEATVAGPATPGGDPLDPTMDPLLATIIHTMTTAIRDQADVSSVAPIILRVPAQYASAIQHLTFWSEMKAESRELRAEALGRLANAVDAPSQVLLGLADVNHWTGFLLDDNSITQHVEPLGELMCHGLTTSYLWPVLMGDNPGSMQPLQARTYAIEADTSGLRQRPNRSTEAKEDHEAMLITDATYLRERGYEDTDYLDPTDPETKAEYQRRWLQRVAAGVVTPDVVVAALRMLGIDSLPEPVEMRESMTTPAALPAPTEATVPPPADPGTVEAPQRPAGDQALAASGVHEAQLAALVLGAESQVHRAMERAMARVHGSGRRNVEHPKVIPADRLDAALMDAWSWLPRVAAMTGTDETLLRDTVDTYTRGLLAAGQVHDPVKFIDHLRGVLTHA